MMEMPLFELFFVEKLQRFGAKFIQIFAALRHRYAFAHRIKIEQAPVHEHIPSTGREIEPAVAQLDGLLDPHEVARTRHRVQRLLRERVFPYPGNGWPSLPWPAF